VVEGQGFLSDHYAPTEKALHLSPEVFNGTNAAAAGVAAHEVGHALQHHQGDLSMWGRTILVYPAYFGAQFAPILIMISAGLGLTQHHHGGFGSGGFSWAWFMAMAGVVLFGISTLCSLIVVFNEFNASARARVQLARLGIVHGQEEEATVSGVLTAAGLTYLAAAIGSLVQLLYWMWRAGLIGGRRND
jgi:Zn-dependent membrane protease YugP